MSKILFNKYYPNHKESDSSFQDPGSPLSSSNFESTLTARFNRTTRLQKPSPTKLPPEYRPSKTSATLISTPNMVPHSPPTDKFPGSPTQPEQMFPKS